MGWLRRMIREEVDKAVAEAMREQKRTLAVSINGEQLRTVVRREIDRMANDLSEFVEAGAKRKKRAPKE